MGGGSLSEHATGKNLSKNLGSWISKPRWQGKDLSPGDSYFKDNTACVPHHFQDFHVQLIWPQSEKMNNNPKYNLLMERNPYDYKQLWKIDRWNTCIGWLFIRNPVALSTNCYCLSLHCINRLMNPECQCWKPFSRIVNFVCVCKFMSHCENRFLGSGREWQLGMGGCRVVGPTSQLNCWGWCSLHRP